MDAIQPPFNLIHRDAAADVLLWAREHETGVIVYSPMASGLLTGTFTAERAARLDPGDWRRGHPDFTAPALSANLALATALRPVAVRHGVTPAAVAWTLAFPGVTGAIVGARRPGQVDGWLRHLPPSTASEPSHDRHAISGRRQQGHPASDRVSHPGHRVPRDRAHGRPDGRQPGQGRLPCPGLEPHR